MAKAPTQSKTSTRSASAKAARPAKGASQKAARPTEPAPAPAPAAAPTPGNGHAPGQPPLPGQPQGALPMMTMALETSARVKRQRDLDVTLPMSTSARMAEQARASVWAISSEKTTMQFQAAEAAADKAEVERTESLVDVETTAAVPDDQRRGSRDLYAFLREELERPEDPDNDPHALWRRAFERRRHEMLAGASPAELLEVERRLGAKLPPSFFDFSLEWGGGELYINEYGAIRVVAALGIVEELTGPLCGRMRRPYLPVVDLGCGDWLAVDLSQENKGGESPVVWWYAGEVKKKVAESFGAWLRKLVESGGEPYWWT